MKKFIAIIICISICLGDLAVLKSSATSSDSVELFSQSKSEYFDKNYLLSGNEADDMLAVAEKQLRKTTSDLHYTEAWCANFVCDVARLVGVNEEVIPHNKYDIFGSCTELYKYMVDTCKTPQVTNRQKGDLVFYYCSKCKKYVHIGIVEDATYSIEGNLGNQVKRVTNTYYEHTPSNSTHSVSNGDVILKYLRPAYKSAKSINIYIQSENNSNWFDSNKDLTISWNSLADATNYRFSVATMKHNNNGTGNEADGDYDNTGILGDMDKILTSNETNTLTFPAGTFAPDSAYKIWVGGYSGTSLSDALPGSSYIYVFTNPSSTTVTPPQITSPANGYVNADPGYVYVSWTSVAGTTSYTVDVKEYATNRHVISRTVYTAWCEINADSDGIQYLADNTKYKITVTAHTASGDVTSAESTFSTTNKPYITYPTQGQAIDSTSLTVEWNGTTGATDYRILLKDGNGNVVPGYNEVSTNGREYYSISGLENGKTYTIGIYAVVNGKQVWQTQGVTFYVESAPVPTDGLDIYWHDIKDGDIVELTIDSSRPTRPYIADYSVYSEDPDYVVEATASNPSIVTCCIYTDSLHVTPLSDGITDMTLTINSSYGSKSISFTLIITDTNTGGSSGGDDNTKDETAYLDMVVREQNPKVGEDIIVGLMADVSTPIIGGSFNLNYDNSRLRLVEITKGDAFGTIEPVINKNYTSNSARITFASATPFDVSGNYFNVRFTAISTGDAQISTGSAKFGLSSGEYIYADDLTWTPLIVPNDAYTPQISADIATVAIGGQLDIEIYGDPNMTITWSSDNTSIATISPSAANNLGAIIKGVSAGTTYVRASINYGGSIIEKKCQVEVIGDSGTEDPGNDEDYYYKEITMKVGETLNPGMPFPPAYGTTYEYMVCDPDIVDVIDGTMVALKPGKTFVSYIRSDYKIVEFGIEVLEDETSGVKYEISDGVLTISGTGAMTDYASTSDVPWYADRLGITEIVIGDGITYIGARAFYNCVNVQKITIPKSVTSAGSYALKNCNEATVYGESGTYAQTLSSNYGLAFVNTKSTPLKNLNVEVTNSSSYWYFDIIVNDCADKANVYVALYDSTGKIVKIESEPLFTDDVTSVAVKKSANVTGAKVFVLKPNLTPITAYKQISNF